MICASKSGGLRHCKIYQRTNEEWKLQSACTWYGTLRRGAEEHSMERRLSRRLCCNRSRRRPTYASKLVVPQRSISFFMLLILVSGVRTLVQCNIRLVRSEPLLLLIWFGSDPALIFKKKVQRNCNTALNMGRKLRKLEIPFKIWRWGLPPSTWPAEGYAGLQSK